MSIFWVYVYTYFAPHKLAAVCKDACILMMVGKYQKEVLFLFLSFQCTLTLQFQLLK